MTPRIQMLRNLLLTLGLVSLLFSACAPGPNPPDAGMVEDWKAELMDADRAFNDATAREGASGWVSFFSDQGAMISEGIGEVRGREAIFSLMEGALGDPSFHLSWDPLRAEVSEGGDLGYTIGRYESTSGSGEDAVVLGRGLYVSIWRRQADGSWKVEMDLGNPTEETPSEGGPGEAES